MVDAATRVGGTATAPVQNVANGLPSAAVKKGKSKKAPAAEEIKPQELLAARINELQGIRDGEREQEVEIDREVKKANRELWGSIAKLDDMAKMTHLQNRCSQLLTDLKRLQRDHKITKTRADKLQKERDGAKSDLTKVTSMRDKLEKLSRETTTDNRKLRAENSRIRDEDVKKRELLQERIDSMVYDVEDVINAREQSRNQSDTHENDDLFRQQFKSFVDQYELRELHFHSALRTKDLEIAYHVAKLDQQKRAQEAESSRSSQLTRQVSTFSQTETELRTQLNIYVEKFKQVEDTLNSSNDLFLTFRKEMEEMSKKTKRLEKENLALSRKHEVTNANIIKMAEERNRTHKELELLRKKNENLEKLCRGMQAQGRGIAASSRDHHSTTNGDAVAGQVGLDDEGTESEYDDYDDDGDLSLDDEFDGGGGEQMESHNGIKANGTVPLNQSARAIPTPPATSATATATAPGSVNGVTA